MNLLKHNLPKALEHFCYTISNTSETKIDLHVHNYEPLPDKSLELIIYRMIQELVQNIMKHAAATQAEIQIMMYEGKLNITVEDNGRGFDLNKEYSGIGLQNLRNRANTLKGYLSITSSPGRSTTVHMEFDIEKLNLALNPDEH